MTETEAKNLLAALVLTNPGKAIALMQVDSNRTTTIECIAYTRTGNSPYSHITLLFQAILSKFSRTKAGAEKMYTSIAPTEMCKGMAKVIDAYAPILGTGGDAKAVSEELVKLVVMNDPATYIGIDALDQFKLAKTVASPGLDLSKEARTEDHTGYHTVHRVYMMLAYALLVKRTDMGLDEGHNIGVVVAGKDGQIVAWGVNTNSVNTTRHGEVNAIQSFFKFQTTATSLPKGVRIYTTLKPCKMCAGMIFESAADKDFRVYWGQDDGGDPAKNTALDQYEKSQRVVLQKLLSRTDTTSVPKPIRLYDSGAKEDQSMAQQLTTGQGTTPVTKFLSNDTATSLMTSAVATLQRKALRNQVTTTTATSGKTVNPNVKKALQHIYQFMVDQGIVAVLT